MEDKAWFVAVCWDFEDQHFGLPDHHVLQNCWMLSVVWQTAIISWWEVKTLHNAFSFQTNFQFQKVISKMTAVYLNMVNGFGSGCVSCLGPSTWWGLGMRMREGACTVSELLTLLYNADLVHLAKYNGTALDCGKLSLNSVLNTEKYKQGEV